MDLILGTEWLYSNNNENKTAPVKNEENGGGEGGDNIVEENREPEQISWLRIMDEYEARERAETAPTSPTMEIEEQPTAAAAAAASKGKEKSTSTASVVDHSPPNIKGNGGEEQEQEQEQQPTMPDRQQHVARCVCRVAPITRQTSVPLLSHLCQHFKCTVNELQLMFHQLDARRKILDHLRRVQLRTNHVRPLSRNFAVRCNDLTVDGARTLHAYNGFLEVTVMQHFFIRYGLKLKWPQLPCAIEQCGGQHRSYYPLEVLNVTRHLPTE